MHNIFTKYPKLLTVLDKLPVECLKPNTYKRSANSEYIIFTNGIDIFIEDDFYGIRDFERMIIASEKAENFFKKICVESDFLNSYLRGRFSYEFHVRLDTGEPNLYVFSDISQPFYAPLEFIK
jgi:hypothetical protein